MGNQEGQRLILAVSLSLSLRHTRIPSPHTERLIHAEIEGLDRKSSLTFLDTLDLGHDTHQSEKLVVATAWSTLALEIRPTAAPAVGEELLVKEQLVNPATFLIRTVPFAIRLSCKELEILTTETSLVSALNCSEEQVVAVP